MEAPPPERETVIKFVISGPFLNAEAAHTQWSAEPPPTSAVHDLLRRIADLERKLDEERALVEMLSRQMPAAPAPDAEPVETPTDPPPLVEPAPLRAVETVVQAAARTVAAPGARTVATPAVPAPPTLSTVARMPPGKVRGLRRMIGALRHL